MLIVQGDNNGLQTVAAALELVYTDPAWPSTAPALNTSLRYRGLEEWLFSVLSLISKLDLYLLYILQG